MTKISRQIMSLVVVSIALLANAGPTMAFDARATDAAFAALLSMLSAKPETGSWNFPMPEDYSAKDETGLIAYLDKQQRKGADFNAYRHFGTLLHHAIRAKLTKTTFWLLDHGADPRKTLLNGTENALALSVRYEQQELAKTLRDKYGLTTPPRIPPSIPANIPIPSEIYSDKLKSAQFAVYGDLSKPKLSEKSLHALAAWEDSVRSIPDDRYAARMDDDDSLIWLVQAYSRTPEALDKALARLPVALLRRHSTALVGGLTDVSFLHLPYGQTQGRYTVPEKSWRVLWRRIGQQIDYAQTLVPPSEPNRPVQLSTVAGRIQPSLWNELFASGYQEHHAENALGCLLNQIDASSFKNLWPMLTRYFPDIREAAPGMLLSPFQLTAYGKPRFGFCYGSNFNDGLKEKLAFLTSQGVKGHVIGVAKGTLRYKSAELIAAMEPFIDHTDRSGEKPRLVDATLNCHFVLTPLIHDALLHDPTIADGYRGVYITSVQSIEIPGEKQCGLLVMGDQPVDAYVPGDFDSFTGPDTNITPSCPDPIDSYQIWLERGGRIEHIPADFGHDQYFQSGLSLVQDTVTGKRHYLRSGPQPGRCTTGNSLPIVTRWQKSKMGWALNIVTDRDVLDALYKQCRSDDNGYTFCQGIRAFEQLTQAEEAKLAEEARQANLPAISDNFAYDLPTFIKVFRKPEYEGYLNAVMSLDKPKLRGLRQTGIPGNWTAEAIQKVGESQLSLGEKRKRIAWLFYDHAQLEKALNYDVFQSLVSWLPEEDWRPILDIVSKRGSAHDYGLHFFRDDTAEHGMKILACGIDNALGLICGETWSTETADP